MKTETSRVSKWFSLSLNIAKCIVLMLKTASSEENIYEPVKLTDFVNKRLLCCIKDSVTLCALSFPPTFETVPLHFP